MAQVRLYVPGVACYGVLQVRVLRHCLAAVLFTIKIVCPMRKMSYQEFLLAAQLTDQSDIVELLFKSERDSEIEDGIYNKSDYLVTVGNEKTTIPCSIFFDLLDYHDLEPDASELVEREDVLQWRLVPVWLGNLLIKRGETVLKFHGSNWWGIREVFDTGAHLPEVLEKIYNDLPGHKLASFLNLEISSNEASKC